LEETASASGARFFEVLTRVLCEVAGTRYALFAEVVSPTRLQIVALTADGRARDPRELELGGNIHEEVLRLGAYHCASDASRLFPEDLLLSELSVQGFTGIALRGLSTQFGVLSAFHDAPLRALPDPTLLLETFALRAAAEVKRVHLERALARQAELTEASTLAYAQTQASEAKLREIVSTCIEGVWTIGAQGGTTFVNAQMASMLGYEPSEMMGRPVSDFAPEDALASLERNMERRRRGVREQHDFRMLRKDGSELLIRMSTTPLQDAAGNFTGALAVVSDLSERQGLERQLQSVQKLESLARLAGGVAHDFNNLLVGILGNVGFALSELPETSPLHAALEDAQHAALRAADLTKQMLAYSGKGRFVLERMSLSKLLEEMTPLLGSGLSKNVQLSLELVSALPEIEADPAQMRQLVMNLLTNAGDALGDQRGTIKVSTGTLSADRAYLAKTYLDEGLPAGEYVFLDVSDTGPGIEPEAVAKIFDPFFTTKFTGRGLGLAAVLGILRGHRGAIRVDSKPKIGSTFRILLPVAAELELDEGPSAPPDSGVFVGQGLVLVADDEEMVRNVATRVLAKCGFRVIAARDGAEAVNVYKDHAAQIVLVLLDVTMPGMGGEDVFRELQRIRPNVRVILTSGYSESDVTSSFDGRGLAGFLQKPWVPSELVRTLRRAFGA
jgi:PAS domain S-box-containing protein